MPPAWSPRGAEGKGSSQGPGFFRPFFLPEKSGWKIPLPGVSMAAHFRHDGAQGLLEIRRFLRHGIGSSRARRSPSPKNTNAPTERGGHGSETDWTQQLQSVSSIPPNQAVFARFEPRGRFVCPP